MKPTRSIAGCVLGALVFSIPAVGQTGLKSYPVQGFDRITIRIPATVGIGYSNHAGVRISAEAKVLDRLLVTERDRNLIIDSPMGFSTTEPLAIAIDVVALKRVVLESAADVTIRRPRGERLDLRASGAGSMHVSDADIGVMSVRLNGAGTVKLEGKATGLEIQLSGASTVNASSLRAARVTARVDGASDVSIHADEAIDATVNGSGTIRYQGKATVNQRISGTGSVERNESISHPSRSRRE